MVGGGGSGEGTFINKAELKAALSEYFVAERTTLLVILTYTVDL